MIENRKAPRITTSMAIAFSSNGNFVCGNIINLSVSGLFIKTETVLPVDTELALSIRLPEDLEIMDIAGKVVWGKQASKVSPAGIGIEFVSISSKDRRKIHSFIERGRKEMQESNPSNMANEAALL